MKRLWLEVGVEISHREHREHKEVSDAGGVVNGIGGANYVIMRANVIS